MINPCSSLNLSAICEQLFANMPLLRFVIWVKIVITNCFCQTYHVTSPYCQASTVNLKWEEHITLTQTLCIKLCVEEGPPSLQLMEKKCLASCVIMHLYCLDNLDQIQTDNHIQQQAVSYNQTIVMAWFGKRLNLIWWCLCPRNVCLGISGFRNATLNCVLFETFTCLFNPKPHYLDMLVQRWQILSVFTFLSNLCVGPLKNNGSNPVHEAVL